MRDIKFLHTHKARPKSQAHATWQVFARHPHARTAPRVWIWYLHPETISH